MSKVNLKLDWCSYEAAKYAVENWHYSKSCPVGKTAKIGVWENDEFIGCVLFSYGSNQHLGKVHGLTMFQCVELVRIALKEHLSAVSRIIAISIKMLKKAFPKLELLVSYADVDQEHHGGIYAASGWVYQGMVQTGGGTPKFKVNGKVIHGRSLGSKYGKGSQTIEWCRKHLDPKAEKVYTLGKHKYLFALTESMKKKIIHLHKPYPKRATSIDNDVSVHHTEEGGASPTVALHFAEETV